LRFVVRYSGSSSSIGSEKGTRTMGCGPRTADASPRRARIGQPVAGLRIVAGAPCSKAQYRMVMILVRPNDQS
jgi:hypothetical protein